MSFNLAAMRFVLRKSLHDPDVLAFIGGDPAIVERSSYYGFIEFKSVGVSMMFKEAEQLFPSYQVTDPKTLHVAAFHMHRNGHEGHSEYIGTLPNGLQFGDTEEKVLEVLGPPLKRGGGGMSEVVKRPIPKWIRYSNEDAILHFQLDADNKVEMATLCWQ